MIEISIEECYKVDKIYNKIKNIILSKKDNPSFNYRHKQHHLYEESKYPGISKKYYNEYGSVEFENINGETIFIEISRSHPHKHNGFSGLNGNPCLSAIIYVKDNEAKKILWELNVQSGTLYYKAEVSSLEIPYDVLKQKPVRRQEKIDTNAEIPEIVNEDIMTQNAIVLFDELKKVQDQYSIAKQTNEGLLIERNKEIENATNQIMELYSKRIGQNDDNINSVKRELNNIDKLISKYSTFNVELVGKALQQLITIFEGEEFVYGEVKHTSKDIDHGVMDSWEVDVETKVKLIIIYSKFQNYYNSLSCHNSVIKNFVNNGDAILLSEEDVYKKDTKKIVFYTLQDGQLVCRVNFGRFDYIKEFIDDIIQYRFQNDLVEFTKKEMLLAMQQFIIKHEDKITSNYVLKIKGRTLKLEV